jgi:hypothetical protein
MTKTALKWALAQLNKKMEEKPDGKIKTKLYGEEKAISYEEIKKQLCLMLAAAEEGRLQVVTLCKNCKAFSGGPKGPTGCCFPKHYTSSRKKDDYCSFFLEDKEGLK